MSYGYCYDSTGTKCSGKAQPGVLALRNECRPRFKGCADWGIYNCRKTRSGSSLSTHAEGRGWDAGFPGLDHPEGFRLANHLVAHAEALGVQRVIWSDRQWDSKARAWRSYGRKSNNNTLRHRDHVHVELCWAAARSLTRAQVAATFGAKPEPEPVPKPVPVEEVDMFLFRPDSKNHVYLTNLTTTWHIRSDDVTRIALEKSLKTTVAVIGDEDAKAILDNSKVIGEYAF